MKSRVLKKEYEKMKKINEYISRTKNSIVKNFKKDKRKFFIFLIIWFLLVTCTLVFYRSSLGKESFGSDVSSGVYDLDKNTIIEQRISIKDTYRDIAIKYATFLRNNSGNVYIRICGEDSKIEYLNARSNVKTFQDNAYIVYSLSEEINPKKDSYIMIYLTSDSEPGKCSGVYYTLDNYFSNNSLTVNKDRKTGEIQMRILLNNDKYLLFSNTVISAVIIAFTLIILLLLLCNPKMENIFTMMLIVFGLVFTLIMSPGGIPDECDHYELSLQVSNLMLFEKNNEIDKAYVNYDSFGSFVNASYSYNRFMRDINKPLELKGEVELLKNNEKSLFKHNYIVYYIPQAIGVTVSRVLKANTLRTFYAGRITNLLFYVLCVYIALKNTPIHKLLFGILSVLPIFVQQAASYSYDSFINGLTFISIAFFFKWMYGQEKVSAKDIVIVFITSLMLAPAKIVYAFFAFLYWIIPAERYGGKRNKILISSLISAPAVCIVCVNIWWRIEEIVVEYIEQIKVNAETIYSNLNNSSLKDTDGGYEIRGGKTYSISYVLSHPVQTIQIILRTVRFWLSTWFYQSIGRTLSGLTLILPMTYVRIVLAIIGVSALRKENYYMTPLVKAMFILVCLVVSLFIILGMLFGWTLTTDDMIQGIQGRYFCPLLPYFFCVFNNKKISVSDKYDKHVIFSYILLMFEVIIYVLSYTFVN